MFFLILEKCCHTQKWKNVILSAGNLSVSTLSLLHTGGNQPFFFAILHGNVADISAWFLNPKFIDLKQANSRDLRYRAILVGVYKKISYISVATPGTLKEMCGCGAYGQGLAVYLVLGWWLDLIVSVFSNPKDSKISNQLVKIASLWEVWLASNLTPVWPTLVRDTLSSTRRALSSHGSLASFLESPDQLGNHSKKAICRWGINRESSQVNQTILSGCKKQSDLTTVSIFRLLAVNCSMIFWTIIFRIFLKLQALILTIHSFMWQDTLFCSQSKVQKGCSERERPGPCLREHPDSKQTINKVCFIIIYNKYNIINIYNI